MMLMCLIRDDHIPFNDKTSFADQAEYTNTPRIFRLKFVDDQLRREGNLGIEAGEVRKTSTSMLLRC